MTTVSISLDDWVTLRGIAHREFDRSDRMGGSFSDNLIAVYLAGLQHGTRIAKNAERTEIANTVANTDAIETEKPRKDG